MFEESPYAPILKLTWGQDCRAPPAHMQSTAPATSFAPPSPDAARRLLAELARRGVTVSGFEGPPERRASDAETIRVRTAEYRHFLEVVTLGLAVQLVAARQELARLRLAVAVQDGSALDADLGSALNRLHALRGTCTELLAIVDSIEGVAPLLRRHAAQDRGGLAGEAHGGEGRDTSREGSSSQGGRCQARKRGRAEAEAQDRQGEAAAPTCWTCRRRQR